MTAPTSNALPPSPLASPSSHSRASSWWSTVASAASASWSRLPPLLAVPASSPSRPPPSPSRKQYEQRHSSPPLPNLSENDENDHNDDDDDELSWQVVLTNHGQASSIDGSSCPLVMPESRFVQLPQLQPIHGLLPFDEADDSGSETDDDDDDDGGDQYVTRTLASPDAPPFAVAAIAAASPLVSPSIPAAGHEPMLVATVDAHALDQEKDSQLDDDAVSSTSSDEDDEDEVEMSIDQLDLLLSQTRSPHSNSSNNNNNNNMDPTLTASRPSSPSPSPSPLPLPSPPPPSTSLSPIDSGILVPIPTWAWHLILNPNADATPVDPPKPPIARKSKARNAKTSTMDLRRVARDAISAHGCMGRFQRQHGPQPAGAAHKRHAAVAVAAGGGKRGAGKSAV